MPTIHQQELLRSGASRGHRCELVVRASNLTQPLMVSDIWRYQVTLWYHVVSCGVMWCHVVSGGVM